MGNDKTTVQVDAKEPYNVLDLVDFWCVLAGYCAQQGVERVGYEPGKVVSGQFVNVFACHCKKTEFYPIVSKEFQIMIAIVFQFFQVYPVVNSGIIRNNKYRAKLCFNLVIKTNKIIYIIFFRLILQYSLKFLITQITKLLTFKRPHLTSPSSPKITPCFLYLLHNTFSFAHTLEDLCCFVGSCSFPLQGK